MKRSRGEREEEEMTHKDERFRLKERGVKGTGGKSALDISDVGMWP